MDDLGIVGIAQDGGHLMAPQAHDLAQVRRAVIGQAHAQAGVAVAFAQTGHTLLPLLSRASAAPASTSTVPAGSDW